MFNIRGKKRPISLFILLVLLASSLSYFAYNRARTDIFMFNDSTTLMHILGAKMQPPAYLSNFVQIYDYSKEDLSQRSELIMSSPCIPFKAPGGAVLCTYSPKVDNAISSSIAAIGTWHTELLEITDRILKQHPQMAVLDMGCNIGVFTVYTAKLNRRVVSVDPNENNLRLLYKSLILNKLLNNVTLLWNAVSDVHEKVNLHTKGLNVGAVWVETANGNNPAAEKQTITMDDLIPFFKEDIVFIKMDIEGHELKALSGGRKFFTEVKVKYVLMEFALELRTFENGKSICEFMWSFGYKAFEPNAQLTVLDTSDIKLWPEDVLWIKQ